MTTKIFTERVIIITLILIEKFHVAGVQNSTGLKLKDLLNYVSLSNEKAKIFSTFPKV